QVPDPDRSVGGGGRQPPAIGVVGQTLDGRRVAPQGQHLFAFLEIPHLHGPIVARAGEALAVGAEGDLVDVPRVSAQLAHLLAAGGVPDPDLTPLHTLGRLSEPATAGHQFPVAADGDALHRLVVPRQRPHQATVEGVVDLHQVVHTARYQ